MLLLALIAAAAVVVTTRVASGDPSEGISGAGAQRAGVSIIVARQLAQVAPVDPPVPGNAALGTVLEGPAFGPDGLLYFVRATAPSGQPKIIAFDPMTRRSRGIYTDDHSILSSVQFSPADGKLYATDFTGAIHRLNRDGTGFTTVVSGPVLGSPMVVDDLAFDRSGAMFAVDMRGTPWSPVGRLIRFDPDGSHPTLLLDGLAAPNGISFTPDFSALWVSEFTAGREDYLPLSGDHTAIATGIGAGHIGMYISVGQAQLDSNAVDTAGNIYQCVFDGGEVRVFTPDGSLVAKIVVPQTLPRDELLTTNLAIKPGTRAGYLVVGGHSGGFVYSFKSLAPGGWQSNGGGA
ncbi:MAG TPA: SMP-30/gluconolactonase/LRE family protein [Jatrophihabitantaceae bacterium]